MQVLGLPTAAIQSYVLDNDPVPRAMLSADPAFTYLSQTTPVSLFLKVQGDRLVRTAQGKAAAYAFSVGWCASVMLLSLVMLPQKQARAVCHLQG